MLSINFNVKFALIANAGALLLLGALRAVGKLPTPLLYTMAVIYVVCFTLFWGFNRKSKAPAFRKSVQLWIIWGMTTIFLLSGIYHYDRAGWIWYNISGYNETMPEELSQLVNISSAKFVRDHPNFVLHPRDSNIVVLAKGEYDVNETIVVPTGGIFIVEPGTILRFAVGRSLISYRPIIARGTENASIIFTAQTQWRKWGGVGVINADSSVFEHVKFEHGRQARVNNIDLFGSLSIIESTVEIAHSQFTNLFGKDGVYIGHGNALVHHNLFRDIFKDGLDFDGGKGVVSGNRFINCGDEGIDLSDNDHIQVFNNIIRDCRGGRIAADSNLEMIESMNSLK